MNMKPFSYRIGNLELRSCDEHQLVEDTEHTSAHIVEWDEGAKPHCWVLLFWKRHREGYDIHFVGDRPFRTSESLKTLWKLMKHGQKMLGKNFNKGA